MSRICSIIVTRCFARVSTQSVIKYNWYVSFGRKKDGIVYTTTEIYHSSVFKHIFAYGQPIQDGVRISISFRYVFLADVVYNAVISMSIPITISKTIVLEKAQVHMRNIITMYKTLQIYFARRKEHIKANQLCIIMLDFHLPFDINVEHVEC